MSGEGKEAGNKGWVCEERGATMGKARLSSLAAWREARNQIISGLTGRAEPRPPWGCARGLCLSPRPSPPFGTQEQLSPTKSLELA